METAELKRLLPGIEAVAEELPHCQAFVRDGRQLYQGVRVYGVQSTLHPDILYLLRGEDAASFPVDRFSYLCTTPIAGTANHILCPVLSIEEILDRLLELFSRYREQERLIDQLVCRGASLQELCNVGAEMLSNPVYIHDDWFMLVATSSEMDPVMTPEYVMSSAKGFVPRVIVDDFKYDSDYLETYSYRNARIWHNAKDGSRCLYVNLWEGTVYRGRLLVIESECPFRQSDFILAEVLTQRAMLLLHRRQPGEQRPHRSMDDMVFDLLQGTPLDPTDLTQLLGMLGWNKSDPLLCIRIQNQQSNVTAVMEHLIHSDLFRCFPGCYILLNGHQQCVILNLAREQPVLPAMLRHRLAPLCRDYCLYAGISSPVNGVHELHIAYHQAGVALNRAFQLRSDRWIIPFVDCALEHLADSLQPPLDLPHLAAPELYLLIDHDREKGTQYFETFREYLLQERDIPRTAEKLIIHRTTLLYRLKKIQSLISVNLDDPWRRLYFTLSLWILEQNDQRKA